MITSPYQPISRSYQDVAPDVYAVVTRDDASRMYERPPAPRRFLPQTSPQLNQATLITGIYIPADDAPFVDWLGKLNALKSAPPAQFVSLDEAPTQEAFSLAEVVLKALQQQNLLPSHIRPSAEGGIAIIFDRGGRYADVEVFNTGEVLAVTSDRKSIPTVWAVPIADGSGLLGSVLTIREYLHA